MRLSYNRWYRVWVFWCLNILFAALCLGWGTWKYIYVHLMFLVQWSCVARWQQRTIWYCLSFSFSLLPQHEQFSSDFLTQWHADKHYSLSSVNGLMLTNWGMGMRLRSCFSAAFSSTCQPIAEPTWLTISENFTLLPNYSSLWSTLTQTCFNWQWDLMNNPLSQIHNSVGTSNSTYRHVSRKTDTVASSQHTKRVSQATSFRWKIRLLDLLGVVVRGRAHQPSETASLICRISHHCPQNVLLSWLVLNRQWVLGV